MQALLFTLLVPVGWKVGALRVEDVAIGAAVSLVVGTLFWPRGVAGIVGDDLHALMAVHARACAATPPDPKRLAAWLEKLRLDGPGWPDFELRDYAAAHLSQYNQIKRWAWGITDIPYVLERLFGHVEIPLGARLRRFFNLYVNHVNWVFLPVLLMFGASMPIWVSTDFSLTKLGQDLWAISTLIVSCTLLTVLALIYLESLMLPPKPATWSQLRRLLAHLQYFTYPIVGLVLSVIPALEAHTRLLFGQYLEYKITEKGV